MRTRHEKQGHSSFLCFLELSGKGPKTDDAVFGGPVTHCLCALRAFLVQVRSELMQMPVV